MSLYSTGQGTVLSEIKREVVKSNRGEDQTKITFLAGFSEGKDKSGEYIPNAINAELWGKYADRFYEQCQKGSQMVLSGKVKESRWTDKSTGVNRSRHFLAITSWEHSRSTPGNLDTRGKTVPVGETRSFSGGTELW